MEEYKSSHNKESINYMAYFINLGSRKSSNGNIVKRGRCPICNAYFSNHRSYLNHVNISPNHSTEDFKQKIKNQTIIDCVSSEKIDANLSFPERIPPKCSLSNEEINLCQFLCTCSIPINIVTKKEFRVLMDNVKFTQVTRNRARTLLLRYSNYLLDMTYFEMHDKQLSIISDGGTLNGRQFYVLAALTPQKSYFLDIIEMGKTDSESLLKAFEPIIKRVIDERCKIICFCTDNGSNLKKLTRSSDPQSIQRKLKIKAFRISCCIHTGNLTIKDVAAKLPVFAFFKEKITSLLSWMRRNKSICSSVNIEGKIPLIQPIKWKTYTIAAIFIINNTAKINMILEKHGKNIGFEKIPDKWLNFCTILKPLDKLITLCQRDRTLMYEFFAQQLQLLESWKKLIASNEFSKTFIDCWNDRFIKTADLSIGKLAYVMTRSGRVWFKNLKVESNTRFMEEYSHIKDRMKQFASFFKMGKDNFDRLFDNYLSATFQYEDRDPVCFWEEQQIKEHQYYDDNGEKKVISWKDFSNVAKILVQLPSTEALCERVFSHLSCLFPINRQNSRSDLIHAQTIIRMYHILNHEQYD